MHYIFLILFGTFKIFKLQSYYSNAHYLKENIMITKIYHIIIIDQIGPNRSKWTKLTEWAKLDRSRTNGPN